ncbi:hypothetical protein T265_00354 [Opisthorchis viverrini]|uniref:Uncharacterized protein n=1 Tax=Opisthorchis viverrini TaxID=6198 RepID=A0A075A2H2_OPIVI|nr:hypothetical protein T265_00354 [Opisthorchis viverrini]KER33918.1 hypothetical protein T265_00354 [Opisthorchis viverrini]
MHLVNLTMSDRQVGSNSFFRRTEHVRQWASFSFLFLSRPRKGRLRGAHHLDQAYQYHQVLVKALLLNCWKQGVL